MRLALFAVLLGVPMVIWGWPSPWVVVCGAFAAGFVARRSGEPRSSERRPGFIDLSQLPREPVGAELTPPSPCEGCDGR